MLIAKCGTRLVCIQRQILTKTVKGESVGRGQRIMIMRPKLTLIISIRSCLLAFREDGTKTPTNNLRGAFVIVTTVLGTRIL